MSRNFELLQKLGKEPEVSGRAQTVSKVSAVETCAITPPQLDLDPLQRDELMKLVLRIFLATDSAAVRVVTFCGLDLGGDSPWICAHAAQILAGQVAGSVCVVDANLREPGLHEHLGVECDQGLTDALQHPDPIREFVRPSGRPNLWFLSCGGEPWRWETLLGSDRMRARIAELHAEFDYVLIDSPALSVSNDAVSLGRASDGVVLVLKAHSSRREVARKAVKDFENERVRVLGAVLNKRTFPIPENIYNKL